MKIENRVEALELELKILKNEIQSTLLEIREQVLNHYYPELRAEEPARAKHVAARPSEARPSKAMPERSIGNSRTKPSTSLASSAEAKAQIQPFTDIFLQDIDLDDDDLGDEPSVPQYRTHKLNLNADLDDEEIEDEDIEFDDEEEEDAEVKDIAPTSRPASVAPKTREVVLQQLKQSAAVPKAKIKNSPEKEVVEPLVQKPNRRAFAALAAWVGDSVAKVGKERTIQVVETYAASGGNLSSETKSTILQLASLANDAEPATPAGNQEMLGLMVGLDQILGEA